jgi:P4 family phage/plasmid primase-like protien
MDKWVLHGKGDDGHNFRLAIAGNLLDNGATDDQVLQYFMIQTDFSGETTESQIKSTRSYLAANKRPMGCKKIMKECSNVLNGMCETCKNKPKEKLTKQVNLDGDEVKNAIEKGLIEAWSNSLELAEQFQKATPVHYDISKNFWIWNGNEKYYFRCDETDILSNLHKKSGEEVWESTKKREIVECIKITGRRREVKECPKTWIHTYSGIVDYITGNAIAATPDYFLTSPIPHKIGNSDSIPKIDKLFTDWIGDRKQVLYEWLAYNLVDDYPMHRMLILFGSGRNGKSQYAELLTRFVGRKNTTATDLEKVIDSRFEAAKLYRKKSALIGETNFTAIKSSARIKALTGADMLTAEFKNKDPFDYTNTAKITVSTNNLPESLDKTEAFFSRCLIEEFKNQFEDGRSVIDTIPESEYENLLFKCIKLLPALMEKGKFTNEGTIQEKAAKYERISNPFPAFIEKELVEVATERYTPVWVFREMYHSFCVKNGFRVVGEREFTQMLNKNYETKKRRYGEKNWNTVYGLEPKIRYVYSEPEPLDEPLEPLEPDSQTCSPHVKKQVETCGSSGSSGSKQEHNVTGLTCQLTTFADYYQRHYGAINSTNLTGFCIEFVRTNQPKAPDGSGLSTKVVLKE